MSVDSSMADVPNRLKLARMVRGYSRREVDRRANLSEGQTSLLERGMRPNFEAATLKALAGALQVTADWILSGTGPGPESDDDPVMALRDLVDERTLSVRHLEALDAALAATAPPAGVEPSEVRRLWEHHRYMLGQALKHTRPTTVSDRAVHPMPGRRGSRRKVVQSTD